MTKIQMTKPIYKISSFFIVGFLLVQSAMASPEIPGADQKTPIALIGGTVHTVSGATIEDGVVVFDQGKIVAVGSPKNTDIPKSARKIDISGKHVYPALFDAYTNIGLVEINAVRATRDHSESGRFNPNVKANVSVNPDSELIPVTRSNGVLLAISSPTGGVISGRASVMQLDGWTFEDLTLKADAGLVIQWPRMTPVSSWWIEESADEQRKERDEAIEQLYDFFDDARVYAKARAAEDVDQKIDSRLESMLPVLRGEIPLFIRADELQQIQAAVAFAAKQKLRMILMGGYDATHCATLLKKHRIPVIIGATYRLPQRRSDSYDTPFTLPARLERAGISFCISSSGRFGASNVRNLPYNAAMSVAFGLSHENALRSITLSPAEILGVADRVGSLETGKDATLFVSTGDPMETTSLVEQAFVQGREVELNDRHKRLWKKYEEKYRRQK